MTHAAGTAASTGKYCPSPETKYELYFVLKYPLLCFGYLFIP